MAVALIYSGKERSIITKELFTCYENTELPEFIQEEPEPELAEEKMKSGAGSVLCHASLSTGRRCPACLKGVKMVVTDAADLLPEWLKNLQN